MAPPKETPVKRIDIHLARLVCVCVCVGIQIKKKDSGRQSLGKGMVVSPQLKQRRCDKNREEVVQKHFLIHIFFFFRILKNINLPEPDPVTRTSVQMCV